MARLKDINEYAGTSVNPMDNHDQIYELYSVPSYETGAPEIISGGEIGSSKVTVEEGDVLICKINPRINRVWVVKHTTGYPLLASSEWIVVRNKEMNPSYLRWYFMSPNFRTLLASQVTGIGGSLTRAQPKQVATYPVPIVDRAEQDRFATTLELVETLIQKNSDRLKLLDDLVKSQFIEMFGDPVSNPMGWKKIKVRDAFKEGYIARPLDGNHGEKHPKGSDYVEKGVPFLMAQDLKDKHVDFSNCHFITEEQAKTLRKGWAKTGDVLLTHKGTIGRVAVVQPSEYEDMLLTPQITYYRCLRDLNNEYLAAYFTTDFFVRQMTNMITGATRASVTITQQEELELIIPPMDMQQRFVAFVNQTDKSKFAIKQSLAELETLKKSLMQQYFG